MVLNNFSQGIQNYNESKYNEAIKFLDLAIVENNKNPGVYFYKGCALKNLKKYKEAIDCFNLCLEIYPKYVNALVEKGYAFLNLGLQAEARQCFDQVVILDPTANRYQQLGLQFLFLGETQMANNYFQKVIQIHPKPVEALIYQGITQIILKNLEKASAIFRNVLELDNQNTIAQCFLGYIFNLQSKLENALEIFKRVIEQDKNQFFGYLFRAQVYLYEKQYKQASEDLEFTLELLQEDKYPFLLNENIKEIQKYILQFQNIQKMSDQLQEQIDNNNNFNQDQKNLAKRFFDKINLTTSQNILQKIDQIFVFNVDKFNITQQLLYSKPQQNLHQISTLLKSILQISKNNDINSNIFEPIQTYLKENSEKASSPNKNQIKKNTSICACNIF
ncbi:tetratricopeptide repeat protein (macronuclear) [Tetrahymena thermophila SB210]|uniref:Tetratricopeptide repeat protein n=1 Tax=Tetrahymena thermophila (strain SB210) TaxID=312017 RepID=W7XG01_TETTS|nr:tetratricopeptide repeat protein [Tetrahymena thermophila SB210]EWS71779.1 tetratricopeptide repeat protein [Tetrahymena thermophila SB210]|eukprot:XP_012655666.1 tetratricopeptide repeat protein [Tetrahymena thermophila SB210]